MLRAWDKVWNRMYNMLFFVKKEEISCTFVEKVWEDTQVGGCYDVLPVPLQTPFGTERFLALAALCGCLQLTPLQKWLPHLKGAPSPMVMPTPWMAWTRWMTNMGVWWANSPCLTLQSNSEGHSSFRSPLPWHYMAAYLFSSPAYYLPMEKNSSKKLSSY